MMAHQEDHPLPNGWMQSSASYKCLLFQQNILKSDIPVDLRLKLTRDLHLILTRPSGRIMA
jgi:hypothetical protein